MIADDYAESPEDASALYQLIRDRLVSSSVRGDRKLPLVYVVDSILKNVKGTYLQLMEKDIQEWMPVVCRALPEHDERRGRPKLKKVWILWKESGVFSLASWEAMGRCFSSSLSEGGNGSDGPAASAANATLDAAGIRFGKDGNLLLMPNLRDSMQVLLDQLQDDVDDLEKVSLERLAAIDADLLIKIKKSAEEAMQNAPAASGSRQKANNSQNNKPSELSFLMETRTPSSVEMSKTWDKLNEKQIMKDANGVIASLNHIVREASGTEKRYTQAEATDVIGALATVAVTATLLTTNLQQIKDYQDNKARNLKMAAYGGGQGLMGAQGHAAPRKFIVDKALFTNDGIKELNLAVVGLLYEAGLPFSLNDGWRFADQKAMAEHLDRKFKAAEAQKSITSTHERGWYESNQAWEGQQEKDEPGRSGTGDTAMENSTSSSAATGPLDPESLTVPADETRDRCVVCGINFSMFFDSEDGIFKYKNCREIDVMQAEKKPIEMLVHGTCWKSLGAPDLLTADQALKEIMNTA